MSLGLLLFAALLLGVERACYVWIARAPGSFRRWCARPVIARLGEPIAVVRALFVGFKVLQATVFAGWCLALGDGSPAPRDGVALGPGSVLMLVGQILSSLIRVTPGRQLVLAVRNATGTLHNLRVTGQAPLDLAPGRIVEMPVAVPPSGTLRFGCTIHDALGMEGELLAGDAVPTRTGH